MSDVQAVILAGGLGTRLRPLTYEIPKPMVPVGEKPFLEHQIAMLKGQGVTDVLLLIGYLGDQIERHFGDGSSMGVQIRYSREENPLGTGGALLQARPHLADRFLVLYGDSYLPIDYPSVLAALNRGDWEAVSVAYDNRENTDVKNNMAVSPEDGRVLLYQKDGTDPRLAYVEAGVSALRKRVLELLPEGEPFNLEQTLFPLLIERGKLGSLVTGQRFYDIGTPGRLAEIRRLLA